MLVCHKEQCKKQKNTMIFMLRIKSLELWLNHSILEVVEKSPNLLSP